MKVALLASGQPRFTECFPKLLSQLEGFDHADMYFGFWNSAWAQTEHEAKTKISKLLPKKYRIANLILRDQPSFELPPHKLYHPPAQPENIRWWFERRMAMWYCMKLTFDLIPNEYDIIIRFRPDGYISRTLDLQQINLKDHNLIFPEWPGAGWPWAWLNDHFAIGTYSGIKFYVGLADVFPEYVVKSDPNWEMNGHGTWSSEHILGYYMKENNQPLVTASFSSHLAGAHNSQVFGRSKYTDKHYHLPIIDDPTE